MLINFVPSCFPSWGTGKERMLLHLSSDKCFTEFYVSICKPKLTTLRPILLFIISINVVPPFLTTTTSTTTSTTTTTTSSFSSSYPTESLKDIMDCMGPGNTTSHQLSRSPGVLTSPCHHPSDESGSTMLKVGPPTNGMRCKRKTKTTEHIVD